MLFRSAGSAAISITKLLLEAGFKDITLCDKFGALYEGNPDMNWAQQEIAKRTNLEKRKGTLADMLVGADVFIGVSAPNLVTTEMVKTMNKDAIVFACANPTPEIFPEDAKAGGAKVVSTGRSDYPNQINNVLAFPGIFRGALDVRASDINEEMKMAAAMALASIIPHDFHQVHHRFQLSFLSNKRLPSRSTGQRIENRTEHLPVDHHFPAFSFPIRYGSNKPVLYHIERDRLDLREHGVSLATLESDTDIVKTHMFAFAITHELCFTNVLYMLELSGIPLRAADRGDDLFRWPLIVAGGGCAIASEPLAPFMDLMLLGEGEEMVPELCDLVIKAREEGWSRSRLIEEAVNIPGVYAPSLYTHDANGVLTPLKPDLPTPGRRIVADFDRAAYPEKQVVPFGAVHNRLSLEIARGCRSEERRVGKECRSRWSPYH